MAPTSPAQEALDKCLPGASRDMRQSVHTKNALNVGLQRFIEALASKYPDAHFVARDVAVWVKSYNELLPDDSPERLPEEIFNPYAVGRLLRHHHKAFGLINVGSYGNRLVYALDPQRKAKKGQEND